MKQSNALAISLSVLSIAWSIAALPTIASQETTLRSHAYLIEFATPPGHPLAEQDAARFLNSIQGFKTVQVRHQFDTLLNGVSVEITDPTELQHIQTMESLHSVTPLTIVAPPELSQSSDNALVTNALKLTNTDRVHAELGLTGKGIKVGVIDTGIDYRHPALGGCFGPGCKVAYGWDFVGDGYTGNNQPAPSDKPLDCAGHGTHVAGTIAADGSMVTGVAPGATLGAYRVLGCSGSTTNDIIIAAMEKAVKDGMDVINLSLGEPNGWIDNPVARAILRASARGVLIAAAQGNEASEGLFSANYVGEGPGVLAVASFINTRTSMPYFTTSLDSSKVLYSEAESTGALFPSPQQLAAVLNGTSLATVCHPLPESVKLDGKIALVLRGECLFKVKAENVLKSGAAGILFVNNVPGSLVATTEEVQIKSGSVSKVDGLRIFELLRKAGPTEQQGYLTASATITFAKDPATLVNPAGGTASGFSSYGPDNYLHMKPDVGAPGENIYSTWMTNNGSYTVLSGTSMASPHVAGSLALVLESLRSQGTAGQSNTIVGEDWIRRVYNTFINSAKPARVFQNHRLVETGDFTFEDENSPQTPIQDESQPIESVAKQGAGMVDVYATIRRLGKAPDVSDPPQPAASLFSFTRVLPSALELNDTANTPHQLSLKTRTLTIYNQASEAMQYEISHLPAEALNEPLIEAHPIHQSWSSGTFSISTPLIKSVRADAQVKLPINFVTVPAGQERRISVFIDPPASLPSNEHWIYSGYIVVKPLAPPGAPPGASADAIHVPYVGVKGSMKTLPIFLQTTPEHEIISNNQSQLCQVLGSTTGDKQQLVFTMQGKDLPLITFCLENPTRILELDLLDAATLKVIGRCGANENVGRSPPNKPLTIVPWDGTVERPGGGSKSTSTILDGSNINSASFKAHSVAQRIAANSLEPMATASPSLTTKRGTIIQERALNGVSENPDGSKVTVGNGTYRFRLRALRILGDATKDSDYETLIFPPFEIARP